MADKKRGSVMRCEKSVIITTLLRLHYLLRCLGNCAITLSIKIEIRGCLFPINLQITRWREIMDYNYMSYHYFFSSGEKNIPQPLARKCRWFVARLTKEVHPHHILWRPWSPERFCLVPATIPAH